MLFAASATSSQDGIALLLVFLKKDGEGTACFFNVGGCLVKGQGETIHSLHNTLGLGAFFRGCLRKRRISGEQFGAP